ncbi:MAG: ABC transporter substrate-binding protein [Burkholderiaceae bacterium]
MKRRQFALASLLASPLAQGLAWAQSNKVVLGQSAPTTGPAAQLGIQFNNGAKLFFDSVNAKGGVLGRQIELRLVDDGYEPERTAANTKKFIEDGVFALFGYIGTPTSLAALPLATAAKVPFFAPFTGAQALREPFNRYAVHVRASYFDETAAIVRQSDSVGIKKLGVFYQNDSYGKAGLEGVTRALATLNRKPVSTGTVERNSVDVAKAVADIMAQQPEAIVQISAYKSCAAFVREVRKAGFGGTFYNVSFVGTAALGTELGKDARGVAISQVMPFPFSPITALSGEYLNAVATNKDLTPNYSSMEGYVAAKVFVEALRRAGKNATQEDFLAAVESIQNLNLGGFIVDFSARKHEGSKFVELTMLDATGRVRR